MHSITYKTLLGLGFDTDLIRKIGSNSHTVAALRSLPSKSLALDYDEAEVQIIREKIQRSAIPTATVDKVIEESDGVCCFCADGNRIRPFQIHHAVEYSKTQDHSFDNLILLCPNHHQSIPKSQTVGFQKQARNEWWAIVSVIRAYRSKGISFPLKSFTALDYSSPPDPTALVERFRASNSTALEMVQNAYADRAYRRLRESPFLAIAGQSGSGKSTFARGLAGRFWSLGYAIFLFHAPKENAIAEVLTFLSTADRPCVLLLDDVNLYLSESDLATVQAASRSEALVICTWTRDAAGATSLERHLPDWLLIDWEQLRPGVHEYLLQREIVLAPAIAKRQGKGVVTRVGIGHLDERLEKYMNRFETNAKSVGEFLFLLRGGEEIVARDLEVLISNGRSDIPVLYAAREQIAGFERAVSVEEVVELGNSIFTSSHPVQMTNGWVRRVFESQVSGGRMQEARAHFTTIHREWAARLLDMALASDRASPDADRLLSQVFDFSCAAPERLVRTWSWFRNLPAAGKWTRQVLATKDASEWKTLVGRAAEHDLSTLCFLAEEMHLLFRTPGWGQTVADAFETHESKICRLLTSAKPTDWWSLTRLAWTIGHANQPLASRVWSTFDPSMVAALIEATHPDYLESLSTFLSSASKESSTWATQVGRALNVDLMLNQLHGISQGDAESAFSAMKILRKLGVPIRRSTIRRVAEAFGKALENCPLRSFHLCFAPVWDPTWLIFDRDIQASLVRINEESLARDLESGSPREWRRFSDLTMFAVPSLANLERRIVDRITPEVLARNVSSTAEGHEYELRCLLWSLSRGTKKAKGVIARALYKTVLRACQRVDQERPQLLKALYAVDPEQAERLKAELVPYGEPEKQDWELRETWLDKRDRKLFHRDIIRLKERYAAAEKSGEDYVFEAWTQEDEVGPS